MGKSLTVVLVILGALVLASSPTWAAELSEQDVSAAVKALSERLAAQDARIAELESKLTGEALQNARHEEIAKIMAEMRADASKRDPMPQWLDNLTFFGDLRLRFEHNSSDGIQWKDRNRYRFRLRFGFEKTWLDDQMKVNFRLASGEDQTGQSANQTFDGTFNKKNLWIDRAYAKYSPNAIPGLVLTAGKFSNPLVHSGMLWDGDVNPEGAVVHYQRGIHGIDVFGTFAHLVVNEVNQAGHDTILNVYQAGVKPVLPCGVKTTLAAAFYDFENYEDLGATGNGWNRATRLVDFIAKADFDAFGLPWQTYAEWVHNVADHDRTADFENADDGYAFGVRVGKNKKQGDWSTGYEFMYIEANAAPTVLNDSDFRVSNGTSANVKGHIFTTSYKITDSLTAVNKIYLVQPIIGDRDANTFQLELDLIWSF